MDLLNLSCPAVSQSWSFSRSPSISTIYGSNQLLREVDRTHKRFSLTFSLKSNPIVASECKGNLPAQNLNERHVFPTPLSPRTIILKLLSFFCDEGGVWCRGRLLGTFCSDVFLLSVSSKSALDILVSCVTKLVIIWRYLSGKYLLHSKRIWSYSFYREDNEDIEHLKVFTLLTYSF